jgi:hypothetical protein
MAGSYHGTRKTARFNFNGLDLDDRGGILFCGVHLPLTQWQGPAITSMAVDVNLTFKYLTYKLCCTGVGVSIISDMVRVQRYGKFKKLWIWVQLYIINYYIKI